MKQGSQPRGMRRVLFAILAATLALLACELGYRAFHLVASHWASRGSSLIICAIGESSTRGVPYNNPDRPPFGAAYIASTLLLRDNVLVRVLARDGDTIYPQTMALIAALSGRDESVPGVVFIYSGHNEFLQRQAAPGGLVDAATMRRWKFGLLRHSRLLSALVVGLERQFGWRGTRDLAHYEFYLRAAVQEALDHGLVPILSTVVGNESEFEPCIDRSQAQRASTMSVLAPGSVVDPGLEALATYNLAALHSSHGDWAAARASYLQAYESQGCSWGRASAAQNDLIRRLAREYRIPLVDAVQEFEKRSPHGVTGASMFSDGQHPNLEGHFLLGRLLAEAIAGRFGLSLAAADSDANVALYKREPETADCRRLLAHLHSAYLLTSFAIGQGRPGSLMSGARRHIDAALALAPDSFPAWVLRGLLEARGAQALLTSPAGGAWLQEHGFADTSSVYGSQRAFLDEIIGKYNALGASETTLAAIRKASTAPAPTCH